MEKSIITQRDAILILLNYRPRIPVETISSELPKYLRKNLDYRIQELVCDELINGYIPNALNCTVYHLTKGGKKLFNVRFVKLRRHDESAGQLEERVHAFTL